MFTLDDICNIAVQIECNGERTYREASVMTTVPHFSQLFQKMADDEKRHAEWFENIKLTKPVSPEQQELEAMGRKLLQDMVKEQTFALEQESLNIEEEVDELLEQFISFERDTIIFYEFLGGLVDETESRKQLEMIIEEENCHIDHIREMITVLKERLKVDKL